MLICEVRVYTSDPLVFTLQKRSSGRELWHQVLQVVPLAEPTLFGLLFTDDYNQKLWLDMDKPLGKQVKATAGGDSALFHLKVKIWPPDPSQVKDDLVRCLLVVQLQEGLLDKSILCSRQTLLRVGAYLIQSHLGDHDESRHKLGYSSQFCLLPDQGEMESDIEALHKTSLCRGLSPSECDFRVLELARRLESYGVHSFPARDSGDVSIALGIGCDGIVVSSGFTTLNKFPWAVVQKASYKGKLFFVELLSLETNKPTHKISFKIEDRTTAKEVWQLFVDLHSFYRCLSEPGPTSPPLVNRQWSSPISRKVSKTQKWERRPESAFFPIDRSMSLSRLAHSPPASQTVQRCYSSSSLRRKIVSEWRTCDRFSCGSPEARRKKSSALSSCSPLSSSQLSTSQLSNPLASSLSEIDCSFDADRDACTTSSSGEDEGFGEDGGTCGTVTPASFDEIPDVDIEQVAKRLSEEAKQKPTAYYFIICEIRDTERSYVRDLDILNGTFRSRVNDSRLLLPKQVSDMFLNLDLIHEFHQTFLAELEERLALWEEHAEKFVKCEIGDIMKKRMACMKLYTNYVTNETKIFEMLAQLQSKRSEFAKVCAEFEHSNVCHRPVSEFFYRPFQRMVHYKELLKRLQQKADPENVDIPKIKEALEHIELALEHVNKSTRSAENARKMMRLQRELIGVDNLLRPGRVFIMEGSLLKLGVNGAKRKIFFLFNDILLYAVKRNVLHGSQLLTKKVMPLTEIDVEDEQMETGQWSFKLRTTDGSFIVMASSTAEKRLWLEALGKAIKTLSEGRDRDTFEDLSSTVQLQKRSLTSSVHPDVDQVTKNPEMMTRCANCQSKFGLLKRKNRCKGCGWVVCNRCLTQFLRLSFSEKPVRVCERCYSREQQKLAGKRRGSAYWRQNAVCRRSESPGIDSAAALDEPSPLPHITTQRPSLLNSTGFSPDSGSCTTADEANSSRGGDFPPEEPRTDPALLSPPTACRRHGEFLCRSSSHREVRSCLSIDGLSAPTSSAPSSAQRLRQHCIAKTIAKARSLEETPAPAAALGKVLLSLQDKQFSSDRELSGYLIRKVRGNPSWKRFWLTVGNNCLNLYKSHEDSKLIQSIPLPEFDLSLPERGDASELQVTQELPYLFKLFSDDVAYYFMTENRYSLERWIEVLYSAVRKCHGRCLAKVKGFARNRSKTIF